MRCKCIWCKGCWTSLSEVFGKNKRRMKPLQMIYCRTGKPSSISDVVDTHQLQYDCSQKASVSLIGVGLRTLSEKEMGTICKTNGKWSLKKQKENKIEKKKKPKQLQCHRLISTDPCIRLLVLFGVIKFGMKAVLLSLWSSVKPSERQWKVLWDVRI